MTFPKGSWEFGHGFRDIFTAFKWGLTPNEFWALNREEQALMMAFVFTQLDMAAYEGKSKE